MRNRLLLPILVTLLIILTSCQLPLGKQTAVLDSSLCGLSSSARVSSLTVEDTAARKTLAIPSKFVDKDVTVRFNHLICDQAASDQEVYLDNIMFLDANGNCLGNNCPVEVCNNADDDDDTQRDEGLDPNTCQCANGGSPANEVCNNKDDNCNEQIDDGLSCGGPQADAVWLFDAQVEETIAHIPMDYTDVQFAQDSARRFIVFSPAAGREDYMYAKTAMDRATDPQRAIINNLDSLSIDGWLWMQGETGTSRLSRTVFFKPPWFTPSYALTVKYDHDLSMGNDVNPDYGYLHLALTQSNGDEKQFYTHKLIAPQQWYHFAIVYDGTRVQLFVNGQSILLKGWGAPAPAISGSLLQTNNPLYFGMKPYTDNFHAFDIFNGRLDDVRLYKRALREDEILYRYLGEVCNGLDDDGDGVVDDGLDSAKCACANGAAQAGSQTEICNGNDDDCRNGIDDGFSGIAESCNNIDDNCDGKVDDILTDNIPLNDINDKGVCTNTKKSCDSAAKQFVNNYPSTYQSTETQCDSKDNDCDGSVDENNVCAAPACASRPQGLISWYRAEDNANDLLGVHHGQLGSAGGADVNDPTFEQGQVGKAFKFDGVNDYVKLPDNLFPYPGSSFSFETWFKTTSGGVILGQQGGDPFGTPSGWVPSVYVDTDGKLRVEMFWKGAIDPIVSSTSVNDGIFHHVAVTYDGITKIEKVYLDKVLLGSKTNFDQHAYGSQLYKYQLGTGYTKSWPSTNNAWYSFTGLIDEPSTYTTVLSETEIIAIYDAGSTGKCTERCNGQDDNGNGQIDEGLTACGCRDGAAATTETCNNIDDNCDGTIDGNTENCYTGTAGTNGVGLCHGGTKTCTSGQWGGCAGGIVPVSEVCNTKDDDCNGQIDENNACAVATVPEPDAKWLFLNDVTESQANIPTISHNQEFSEKAVTFETRANWNAMKITSDDSQRSRSSYAYVDYQNAIPEQRNRLDPTDALTVEGWVWNDQDWGWNSWQTVFAKVQEYSGVNPESYALFITPEISLHFVITTDDGGRRYFNTPKDLIQWQKWSHFAVTYDKNAHQVQIFVNGIRVYNLQSGSLSQPLQVKTHNLYFGFRDSSNENDMVPFNGALRDIRLYKRALTPAQVLARYRVYVPEIVLCAENKVGDDVCDEQKHLICIYPEGQGGEGLCNSDGNVRCICGGRYLYREGCADGYSDADGNLYNGCEAHI